MFFCFLFFFSLRRKDIRARCNFQTVFQLLLHCINSLAIKVTGYLLENFDNTPKRYQNLVLWECPKLHTINIECSITILYFTRRVQY